MASRKQQCSDCLRRLFDSPNFTSHACQAFELGRALGSTSLPQKAFRSKVLQSNFFFLLPQNQTPTTYIHSIHLLESLDRTTLPPTRARPRLTNAAIASHCFLLALQADKSLTVRRVDRANVVTHCRSTALTARPFPRSDQRKPQSLRLLPKKIFESEGESIVLHLPHVSVQPRSSFTLRSLTLQQKLTLPVSEVLLPHFPTTVSRYKLHAQHSHILLWARIYSETPVTQLAQHRKPLVSSLPLSSFAVPSSSANFG